MKGFYALVFKLQRRVTLESKTVKGITLEPGTYVYVGSAMGHASTSLQNRIARHFRKQKRAHWHIDYLLEKSDDVSSAVWAKSEIHFECDFVSTLDRHTGFSGVAKGFGASDCKARCFSHLFRYEGENEIDEELMGLIREAGYIPHCTSNGSL